MTIYDKVFVIKDILDSNTKKRCSDIERRIGKTGSFITLGESIPFTFLFSNGAYFISSPVYRIDDLGEAIIVRTQNKTYLFREVKDV